MTEFHIDISNSKRWCCESAVHNMPANVENSAVATGMENGSFLFFFFSIPKKGNAKQCSNYHTITLISHASTTVHEPWTSRCSRKAENQRLNCQHWLDDRKSKRVPEKHLFLLYWLHQNLCVVTTNWKLLKRWEHKTIWPASWEICMQVKKQQLEPDTEQQTSSK